MQQNLPESYRRKKKKRYFYTVYFVGRETCITLLTSVNYLVLQMW